MESSNAEQSSLSTRQSQRERVKKKVFSPSDQLQDLQMTHEEADKIIDVSISPVASGSSSQSIKNASQSRPTSSSSSTSEKSSKFSQESTEDSNDGSVELDQLGEGEVLVKRGRGRPPKIKKITDSPGSDGAKKADQYLTPKKTEFTKQSTKEDNNKDKNKGKQEKDEEGNKGNDNNGNVVGDSDSSEPAIFTPSLAERVKRHSAARAAREAAAKVQQTVKTKEGKRSPDKKSPTTSKKELKDKSVEADSKKFRPASNEKTAPLPVLEMYTSKTSPKVDEAKEELEEEPNRDEASTSGTEVIKRKRGRPPKKVFPFPKKSEEQKKDDDDDELIKDFSSRPSADSSQGTGVSSSLEVKTEDEDSFHSVNKKKIEGEPKMMEPLVPRSRAWKSVVTGSTSSSRPSTGERSFRLSSASEQKEKRYYEEPTVLGGYHEKEPEKLIDRVPDESSLTAPTSSSNRTRTPRSPIKKYEMDEDDTKEKRRRTRSSSAQEKTTSEKNEEEVAVDDIKYAEVEKTKDNEKCSESSYFETPKKISSTAKDQDEVATEDMAEVVSFVSAAILSENRKSQSSSNQRKLYAESREKSRSLRKASEKESSSVSMCVNDVSIGPATILEKSSMNLSTPIAEDNVNERHTTKKISDNTSQLVHAANSTDKEATNAVDMKGADKNTSAKAVLQSLTAADVIETSTTQGKELMRIGGRNEPIISKNSGTKSDSGRDISKKVVSENVKSFPEITDKESVQIAADYANEEAQNISNQPDLDLLEYSPELDQLNEEQIPETHIHASQADENYRNNKTELIQKREVRKIPADGQDHDDSGEPASLGYSSFEKTNSASSSTKTPSPMKSILLNKDSQEKIELTESKDKRPTEMATHENELEKNYTQMASTTLKKKKKKQKKQKKTVEGNARDSYEENNESEMKGQVKSDDTSSVSPPKKVKTDPLEPSKEQEISKQPTKRKIRFADEVSPARPTSLNSIQSSGELTGSLKFRISLKGNPTIQASPTKVPTSLDFQTEKKSLESILKRRSGLCSDAKIKHPNKAAQPTLSRILPTKSSLVVPTHYQSQSVPMKAKKTSDPSTPLQVSQTAKMSGFRKVSVNVDSEEGEYKKWLQNSGIKEESFLFKLRPEDHQKFRREFQFHKKGILQNLMQKAEVKKLKKDQPSIVQSTAGVEENAPAKTGIQTAFKKKLKPSRAPLSIEATEKIEMLEKGDIDEERSPNSASPELGGPDDHLESSAISKQLKLMEQQAKGKKRGRESSPTVQAKNELPDGERRASRRLAAVREKEEAVKRQEVEGKRKEEEKERRLATKSTIRRPMRPELPWFKGEAKPLTEWPKETVKAIHDSVVETVRDAIRDQLLRKSKMEKVGSKKKASFPEESNDERWERPNPDENGDYDPKDFLEVAAKLPVYQAKSLADMDRDRDEPLWESPKDGYYEYYSQEMDDYIKLTNKLGITIDRALRHLHSHCGHNIHQATKTIVDRAKIMVLNQPLGADDQRTFKLCFIAYGKNFFRYMEKMPHLGSKQIIKYYYDTKQVNNYKQARKDFHKSFPYEEGGNGHKRGYAGICERCFKKRKELRKKRGEFLCKICNLARKNIRKPETDEQDEEDFFSWKHFPSGDRKFRDWIYLNLMPLNIDYDHAFKCQLKLTEQELKDLALEEQQRLKERGVVKPQSYVNSVELNKPFYDAFDRFLGKPYPTITQDEEARQIRARVLEKRPKILQMELDHPDWVDEKLPIREFDYVELRKQKPRVPKIIITPEFNKRDTQFFVAAIARYGLDFDVLADIVRTKTPESLEEAYNKNKKVFDLLVQRHVLAQKAEYAVELKSQYPDFAEKVDKLFTGLSTASSNLQLSSSEPFQSSDPDLSKVTNNGTSKSSTSNDSRSSDQHS